MKRVDVRLEMSQQQYDLIKKMASKGDLGNSINEVILAGFFNYLSSRKGRVPTPPSRHDDHS